jgi:hypothetical protein
LSEYQVQITLTNLTTRKVVYDRQVTAYDRAGAVQMIVTMAGEIALGQESDQTYQEMQYNETRHVPPRIDRDVEE